MVDFAEGISDDRAGRQLGRALDGRGAFRRFKDTLRDHPALERAWYAFSDVRARRRAVRWLLDHDLVDGSEAEAWFDEHPDPELP